MNKPWLKILLLLLVIFCYIHLTWARFQKIYHSSNARHSDFNFEGYVLISRQIISFRIFSKKIGIDLHSGC